jgi:hypothetical protein
MKINGFLILVTLLFSSCSSYMKEHQYNAKAPEGFTEIVTARKLVKMTPIQILSLLKDNCCDGVMFEPAKVKWSDKDAQELSSYLEDESDSSPAATIMSSVSCKGARYVSTVKREAQHLILAIKAGRYPLSQCSTYDLNLEKK